MPICTAATLIGEEPLAPKPKKEQVEKLPEETEPIKVLTGADIPDTWIQNQKEVDVMALAKVLPPMMSHGLHSGWRLYTAYPDRNLPHQQTAD